MQCEDPLYRRLAVTCACNNLKSTFVMRLVIRNKDVALYVDWHTTISYNF